MKSLGKQTTLEDIANMETIRAEIAKLVGSAPSTLDTIAELASAIQSNQTVVEALDSAIGNKADKSTVTALATRVTNLENSATEVSFTQTQTSGTKIGAISIDGTSTNIYAPTIPTALKNPNALTFGSKTYDGSAARTITASDLGALTSHQTIYALTIKNSVGTTEVTYNPASEAKSLTLTKSMVGLGNVENTALSSWTGSTNIVRLGTIISGTWQGSKISNSYLANSAITIAGNSVSLGSSITAATLRSGIMGSSALGSTTAYLYWTGSAWGTKSLGALAFKDSIDLSGYLPLSGGTITGALTVKGLLTASSGIKIGSATLSWDSTAGALKVDKPMYSASEVSASGVAEEGEATYGPLLLSSNPSTGTKTDADLANIGLTADAIDGLLSGVYTKVVRRISSSYSIAWDYEAHKTSTQGTTIYLRGAVLSYKYSKGVSATSWTVTLIS